MPASKAQQQKSQLGYLVKAVEQRFLEKGYRSRKEMAAASDLDYKSFLRVFNQETGKADYVSMTKILYAAGFDLDEAARISGLRRPGTKMMTKLSAAIASGIEGLQSLLVGMPEDKAQTVLTAAYGVAAYEKKGRVAR